jgi:hypothetical protein
MRPLSIATFREVLVNDSIWALYEETIREALNRNAGAEARAALCALLWLLRDQHCAEARAFATQACHEDFELPDPRACTVAERIRDGAARIAGSPGCDDETVTGGMQMVAEALRELIPIWDFGTKAQRQRLPSPSGGFHGSFRRRLPPDFPARRSVF